MPGEVVREQNPGRPKNRPEQRVQKFKEFEEGEGGNETIVGFSAYC